MQLTIASEDEPFKTMSWMLKINTVAAPYFAESLTPSSCYTSSGFGSRASELIENYPSTDPATGIVVQFKAGGVVHYNATATCERGLFASSAGYVTLSVQFDIPASPQE